MNIDGIQSQLAAGRAVSLRVKVIPKSSRSEIAGEMADEANAELRALLAKVLGVPQNTVEIVSGATTHLKLIAIRP
jgi:uncharacterized protein YggU (UPF0235/DUF167 family)